MIKEHVINTTIVNLDSYILIDFFNDLTLDYALLKELHANLEEYQSGTMSDDDIEDFFVDVHFESIRSFNRLSKLYICSYAPVNAYFKKVAYYFTDLVDLCTAISNRYYSPNQSETQKLLDLTYKTLAGICFLLGTDYHCYDTAHAAAENAEIDYDNIMYEHFAKFTLVTEDRLKMCLDFAKDVFETSKTFKIKFDVFDAFPEKEEAFAELLGPDIGAIDEDKLTIAIVDDLLAGKITVDELLEKCSYSDSDDDDSNTAADPKKIEV